MADQKPSQRESQSVEGMPWRIYPKGTRRDGANWPVEVHEAWAERDRLRAQLDRETKKTDRLRKQLAKIQSKPKMPSWRSRSGV